MSKQKVNIDLVQHKKFSIIALIKFSEYLKEKKILDFNNLKKEEKEKFLIKYREERIKEIRENENEQEEAKIEYKEKEEKDIIDLNKKEDIEKPQKKQLRSGLKIIKKKEKVVEEKSFEEKLKEKKEKIIELNNEINEERIEIQEDIKKLNELRTYFLTQFRGNILNITLANLLGKNIDTNNKSHEIELNQRKINEIYEIGFKILRLLEKEIKKIEEENKYNEEREKENIKKIEKEKDLKDKYSSLKGNLVGISRKEEINIDTLIGLGEILKQTTGVITSINNPNIAESINMWKELKFYDGIERASIFVYGWVGENILIDEYKQTIKDTQDIKGITLNEWKYFTKYLSLYKTLISQKGNILQNEKKTKTKKIEQPNEKEKERLEKEIIKIEEKQKELTKNVDKIIKKGFETLMSCNSLEEVKDYFSNIKEKEDDITNIFEEGEWKEKNIEKYNRNIGAIKSLVKKAEKKEKEQRSSQEFHILKKFDDFKRIPTIDVAVVNKQTKEIEELLEAKSLTITNNQLKMPLFVMRSEKEELLNNLEEDYNKEDELFKTLKTNPNLKQETMKQIEEINQIKQEKIRDFIKERKEQFFYVQKNKQEKIAKTLGIEPNKVVFYMTLFDRKELTKQEYKIPFEKYISMFDEEEFVENISIILEKNMRNPKERMKIEVNYFKKYFKENLVKESNLKEMSQKFENKYKK